MNPETASHHNDPSTTRPKKAACLECRRSKTKCIRHEGSAECHKCHQAGLQCVVPEYHIGRYKGVKNKRTSLEKAIHQIQQALRRSSGGINGIGSEEEADLRQLLDAEQARPILDPNLSKETRGVTTLENSSQPEDEYVSDHPSHELWTNSFDPLPPETNERTDEIALDNADNPLELLAMVSALPGQPRGTPTGPSPSSVAALQSPQQDTTTADSEIQQFFGHFTANLDNSPDLDPINLGLITIDEAHRLFAYYYENLFHGRWGLDPLLHTTSFVRSRSAFLFTSILMSSALFSSDTASLWKRLSTHHDKLYRGLVKNRCRSVEIVIGFMVSIPWMQPAKHLADDDTCSFLSVALRIALDLSLNKIVIPSSVIKPGGALEKIARAECIDSAKALQSDGFQHVDHNSPWGRRLLRTRERAWLTLFMLDRGICLTRGRPYTVPCSPLIDNCDVWHISDIASRGDQDLIAAVVLRRDLVSLIASVRTFCDGSQGLHDSSFTVKYLKDKIDRFFEQWHTTWDHQLRQKDGRISPPIEILVSHTKLSVYCSVVNHGTASAEVKQFFCAAGLTSAMSVMRAAIEGEGRHNSTSNNAVIMVSFAAIFVLALGTTALANRTAPVQVVRPLIEATISRLERIGSTPSHRNGLSVLFAKHIRRILEHSPSRAVGSRHQPWPENSHKSPLQQQNMDRQSFNSVATANPIVGSDSYLFNMSDDELLEAINKAGETQELFHLDESMFLDSLNWPYVV